ncbi:MAG: ABC transporter permease [Oligoflexales bacterium]|nr:ABC transporter permease [Oligoflexales bacterium]
MTLIKMAFRNIFRNTRRTLFISMIISLGLSALIFMDALMLGTMDNMVGSLTSTLMGEGQIHRRGFLQILEVEKTINGHERIIGDLRSSSDIKAFARRVLSYGMVSSPSNSSSVVLYGVDPIEEKSVSRISLAVTSGTYDCLGGEKMVLIGEKLMKSLEISISDKIIITMVKAGSGEISQDLYRVGGVFKFGADEIDQNLIFANIKDVQRGLGVGENIHEIAFKLNGRDRLDNTENPLWKRLSDGENEALSWRGLAPQLDVALEMSSYAIWIVGIILFIIIAFSIMNTLFMSIYERMFEFGILKAIGTRPLSLFSLILLEAFFCGLLSVAMGLVLGYALTYIFSIVGIDYRGTEFLGASITEKIFTVLKPYQFVKYPLVIIIFTVVSAIYPAIVAAGITPKKVMHDG